MNISYNHGAGQGGRPDFFGCRITHVPIPAPPTKSGTLFFFNIQIDINEFYHYYKDRIWISLTSIELHKVHVQNFYDVGYHLDLCQPPLPKAEVKMFFYIHVDINEFYLSYKHRTWISLTSIELHKVHVHIFYGVRDHKYLDTHPPWSSHLPGDDRAW